MLRGNHRVLGGVTPKVTRSLCACLDCVWLLEIKSQPGSRPFFYIQRFFVVIVVVFDFAFFNSKFFIDTLGLAFSRVSSGIVIKILLALHSLH